MKLSSAWRRACAVCLVVMPMSATHAAQNAAPMAAPARDHVATITILDGQATVVRTTSKLVAVQGAGLDAGDILDTAATSTLVRLELDGAAVLDIGPASRVMLKPPLRVGADGPLIYVLEGWVKLTLGPAAASGQVALASMPVDVVGVARDVVLHVKGGEAELFAESGSVQAQVLGKSGKPAPIKVERGAFVARHADASVNVAARPVAAFIQSVPRAFMDTLPLRAALFKGRDIRLNPAGRLAYADIEPWLHAEPRLRTRLQPRWRPLLQDEPFRRALIDQLALHPEWRHILYPPPPGQKPAAVSTSN